jgi:hypothetical protein
MVKKIKYDITISCGDTIVHTNLNEIKQISRDLKSGKIKFVSDCCGSDYKVTGEGFICSVCDKKCTPKPIRQ